MYSNVFYLTNSPKPKDVQFITTYDKEKQQSITIKRANLFHLWQSIINIVADQYSVDQLIECSANIFSSKCL